MTRPMHAALALALSTAPALADPLTDANFVTAVNICVNFGADGWFARDRLESAGWTGAHDVEFDATVYTSPDGNVRAIPPAEDAGFPAWCTVISPAVAYGFATEAVRSVLVGSEIDAIRGVKDGCLAFRTEFDQTVHVVNDGNEVMCDRPDSARVDVITDTNPIGGQ